MCFSSPDIPTPEKTEPVTPQTTKQPDVAPVKEAAAQARTAGRSSAAVKTGASGVPRPTTSGSLLTGSSGVPTTAVGTSSLLGQ